MGRGDEQGLGLARIDHDVNGCPYRSSMIYENEDREDEECGCNTFDGLGCNVLYTICEVGATATVRGSMDQVAMTGHGGRITEC